MIHKFLEPGPWFRPKMFGYGAGLPIVWQGWVFMIAHFGLIFGFMFLAAGKPALFMVLPVIAALALLPIYAARTEGGWKWRWGRD